MAVKQTKVGQFEGLRPTAEYITRATEVRCRRCNRMLKNLLSVRRGYGPVCWGYVQVDVARARMKPLTEVFLVE